MTENEIKKLLAKAGISLVKQERVPEAERAYTFEREGQTIHSKIEYEFIIPSRLDNKQVSRDLYRIRFADGNLSDLGNLSRVKDAAVTYAKTILREHT